MLLTFKYLLFQLNPNYGFQQKRGIFLCVLPSPRQPTMEEMDANHGWSPWSNPRGGGVGNGHFYQSTELDGHEKVEIQNRLMDKMVLKTPLTQVNVQVVRYFLWCSPPYVIAQPTGSSAKPLVQPEMDRADLPQPLGPSSDLGLQRSYPGVGEGFSAIEVKFFLE